MNFTSSTSQEMEIFDVHALLDDLKVAVELCSTEVMNLDQHLANFFITDDEHKHLVEASRSAFNQTRENIFEAIL